MLNRLGANIALPGQSRKSKIKESASHQVRLLNLQTYISVNLKGNFDIRPIREKKYEIHIAKITLRAEPAPGQYRPTRQDEESKNQGECFVPFDKRLESTQNISPRCFPVRFINFS